MEISIEKLIEIIVGEVVTGLQKHGVEINSSLKQNELIKTSLFVSKTKIIDMSNYKTPLLTENSLLTLEQNICEIIVPLRTLITPGARNIIKKKKLIITYIK